MTTIAPTHKEKYAAYTKAENCHPHWALKTQLSSNLMYSTFASCKHWWHEAGAMAMGEEWLHKIIDAMEQHGLLTVYYCPDEQDAAYKSLERALDRYGLGGFIIRNNGSMWVPVVGMLGQKELDRTGERYGFTNLGRPDTEQDIINMLTFALGKENQPLSKKRKVWDWGVLREDRRQAAEWSRGDDSEESCTADTIPAEQIVSTDQEPEKSGTDEAWVQFKLLPEYFDQWIAWVRSTPGYEVREGWNRRSVVAEWVGGGKRPSWNIPGVMIKGL